MDQADDIMLLFVICVILRVLDDNDFVMPSSLFSGEKVCFNWLHD